MDSCDAALARRRQWLKPQAECVGTGPCFHVRDLARPFMVERWSGQCAGVAAWVEQHIHE
ncbi:MAG: hypothetical protein HC837_13670 [Chloroflexaceae bacterium]|nr:hypothetical protein [Chloroflexaceae bacterium]